MSVTSEAVPPKVSWLYDPKVRGIAYQLVLAVVVVLVIAVAVINARDNLIKQKIASGFGFWNNTAGFDIGQRLIDYTTTSTYGQAFWVGLLNTLLVSALGIVLATLLGFSIGVMRLSTNWLINKIATVYVEMFRNIPLLLQLLFWYNAVLKALPERVADSVQFPGSIYLNRRGLIMPQPVFAHNFLYIVIAFVLGIVLSLAFRAWAQRRQAATGEQAPVGRVALGLIVGLPILVFLIAAVTAGTPLNFNLPEVGRFNIRGGMQVYPEFVALLLGLTIYTAAFIAEAVRAGIQSVYKGQTEAAYALGLRPNKTLDLVVIPQAMRVIIPPLTSQYLNLVKNSSLAVSIGYPDLVQVFAGTVLNQTGQAVEVIAVTMAVYLTISLATSLAMNVYNKRKSLVER